MHFENKTVIISGASRGIGKAIGLRLAGLGANIVVTGKTTSPHAKLPGTIQSAAQEMIDIGAQAIALHMDVRFEDQVQQVIDQTIEHFGKIDILVNNASAISLTPVEHTPMKRFDLMHQVNARGTFLMSKLCIPHLRKSDNPHILMLSPPLHMDPKWFGPHLAYTMSKYGMSMCVLGLAEELQQDGIAVNALWPKTTIATAAVQNLLGGDQIMKMSRSPQIVADAAAILLEHQNQTLHGRFLLDEELLALKGITDLDKYAIDPSSPLMTDLFLDS